MSALFGGSSPTPQPVPVAPVDDGIERARVEREAALFSKMSGRRSTIVGGMALAEEDQQKRGFLAAANRTGSIA